jgi:hypothetical protein
MNNGTQSSKSAPPFNSKVVGKGSSPPIHVPMSPFHGAGSMSATLHPVNFHHNQATRNQN